jgi:fibronectin type 3 domain-containing protein
VKYSTVSGGPYTTVSAGGATSATVTGLTAGATYYFVVSASNGAGESGNSSQVIGTLTPAVPTGLNAVAGNGQVALSWNGALGAATYTVHYGTTAGGPYDGSVTGIAGTATTVSGLTAGATYYFVVSALNGTGESAASGQTAATTAPGAPATIVASATGGDITLNWSPVLGATSYTVKYGTTNGGPYTTTLTGLGGPPVVVSGLAAGGTYYFVVTASNAAGTGGSSPQTSLALAPAAPTGLNAVAGNGQVALTWNGAAGATSYTVKYGTSSGVYTQTLDATVTNATVTGLTNGTLYYFVVTASNAGGTSGNSSQLATGPALPAPGAPTGLNATAGNGQVALTWNGVSGATGYTVSYGTSSGGPYTQTVSVNGASATVTGLANGTAYYFVVSATGTGGTSANSTQASASPLLPAPGAPTGLNAAAGNGQVSLTWNAAATATSYTIRYGTTNGGSYTGSLAVSGNSGTVTGLTNGVAYYFVVSASNTGGASGNSAQVSATPMPPLPAAPAGLTVTQGNGQLGVSWSAVPGATSYNVKYGTAAGGPFTTINTAGSSLTLSGLSNGTTYYVQVSALNVAGEGANSAQASGTPVAPQVTAIDYAAGFANAGSTLQLNGAAQLSNGSLLLTSNVTSQVASAFVKTQQNIAAFTTQFDFQITGNWPLGDGMTFVIQRAGVTALGQGGGGLGYQGIGNSVAIKFDFFDNAGEGTNSTGLYANGALPTTAGSVWLGNTGFDMRSYDLSRATISYDGTTLSVTLKNLRTGATATQNYAVNIPAVIGGSLAWVGFTAASGALTASQRIANWTFTTVSSSPPAAPTGVAAAAGNGQATISWGAAAGATSYNVKYGTASGGPYTATVSSGGTSATIPGLSNGTPYYFVVTAVNSAGESGSSAQATATPLPPAPVAPGGLTATPALNQVGLTWNAVAGAASYNLKYSTTSGGPYTTLNVLGTAATITGLSSSTTYYFVVSALNASGEGANSAQISSTTLTPPPAAPSGLNATAGNGQVALSWSAVAGAASYNVKYATVSGGPYTSVNVGGTSATIPGLTNGTTYYFVVSALNAGGEGANSAQVSTAPVLPPPATPTGLAATTGDHLVALTWNAAAGATSYTVKYGTVSGGPYVTTVGGLTGTGTTITGLSNGTLYYFIITASNSAGESAASGQISAAPFLPLPAAPTGLSAAVSNEQVALSWNGVSGATSYTVKAATVSGGPYATVAANVTSPSATISNLVNGTTYYFVVAANNASGQGANSAQVQATPVSPAVPAPVRPSDVAAAPGNGQVTLNWPLIAGATSYKVRYGTTAGGPYATTLPGITAGTTTITGLANGTTYYFVVTAVNSSGESAYSTEVSALPTLPLGTPVTTINLQNGFAGAGGSLALNGSAFIDGSVLKLTNGHASQISSVYAKAQQNVTNFSTEFDFQITGNWPLSEGFTFVIQRQGLGAIGQGGGGLGYGTTSTGQGITNSVAIKFDVYDNAGEGTNSTGLYVNGAAPTSSGSVWLGNTAFDMRSYDVSRATMTYDGTKLTVTLKNLRTGATATQTYTVNIPAVIGGNTAWVGFTGSDGSIVSTQTILNWKYSTQ